MKRQLLPAFGVTLALSLVLGGAIPPSAVPHFALSSSAPEAGSTVQSPSTVRLTFTQEPQAGTVRIRIVEAEDAGVHVMNATQDSEDPTAFQIELHGTLPPAAYTVSWRGMGADGHVVRDTFQFVVSAPS